MQNFQKSASRVESSTFRPNFYPIVHDDAESVDEVQQRPVEEIDQRVFQCDMTSDVPIHREARKIDPTTSTSAHL